MTDVLVERRWQPPLTDADALVMAQLAEDCLGIYRVDWCGSLLSSDGAQMFCHFRAPDAESVRIALRQPGASPGNAWSCTVEDAPRAGLSDLARVNVVTTHRFDEAVDVATIQALARSAASHLDGRHGCLVRTYVSNHGRRMICLYQSADIEPVRNAEHQAGVAPDRVWAVRRFAPQMR